AQFSYQRRKHERGAIMEFELIEFIDVKKSHIGRGMKNWSPWHEDTLGTQGDLDGRDMVEVGGRPIVEPNNDGEVRGEEDAMASYTD
ncbi:hypothetical protein MTR67_002023, partial [Solanum verrucosum]